MAIYSRFWRYTAPDPVLLYFGLEFDVGTNCTCEDLAAQRSGKILYLSGCNGHSFVLGDLNSEDYGLIFHESGFLFPGAITSYLCVTRSATEEGFFVMVSPTGTVDAVLFYFDENVSGYGDWTEIVTVPSLVQAADSSDQTLLFRFCSMAQAPNGDLDIASFDELWKVTL